MMKFISMYVNDMKYKWQGKINLVSVNIEMEWNFPIRKNNQIYLV